MLEQDIAQTTQQDISSTHDAATNKQHPGHSDKGFTHIKAKKNLQEQFSSVAVKPSHKKFMAVVIVAILGVVTYFVFFSATPSQEERKVDYDKTIKAKKEAIVKEAVSLPRTSTQNIPSVSPKLPEPPPLKEPTPPEPPPPIPAIPQPILPPTVVSTPLPPLPGSPGSVSTPVLTSPFNDKSAEQKRQAIEARRKEGIMVVGGGSGASNSLSSITGDKKSDKKETTDGSKKAKTSFLGFDDGQLNHDVIAHTSAEQVRATRVPYLDRTIIQGKIIFAILETAINTDLPGTLRAIVARDVYGENGAHVLIPKGSRLIGSYDSNIKGGQTRVNIMWDRLIRPDGIDIAIGSSGTDSLGRTGVRGQVDNKFWTRLGNAFLVSYIIPIAINKITGVDKQQITTTTTHNSTGGSSITTSGNMNALTMQDSANKFNQIAAQTVQETFPTQTTIIIDQGTKINILVQKDLVFPAQILNNNLVIK